MLTPYTYTPAAPDSPAAAAESELFNAQRAGFNTGPAAGRVAKARNELAADVRRQQAAKLDALTPDEYHFRYATR